MTDLPDLPTTGSEPETLTHFLDYYRAVARRKVEGLDSRQLNTTLGSSTLTAGGLLKHFACVEDWWWIAVWQDAPLPEPWTEQNFNADPDYDFHSAAHDSPEQLLSLFDERVASARQVITDLLDSPEGLDAIAPRPRSNGDRVDLRWTLVHMIEEYARHCGHLDLIRESLDGQTGD